MIFPKIGVQTWARITGLEVEDYVCSKCRKTFKCDTPIVMKDYAGFQSEEHECGAGFIKAVITPRSREAMRFWNHIL